tara:strand:+ start:1086 stop:1292 length:207 start_codon:yes stop_codon:yes gene_type:complete
MKKQRGDLYTINRMICGYNEGTVVRVYETQSSNLITCIVLDKDLKSKGEFLYPCDADLIKYEEINHDG